MFENKEGQRTFKLHPSIIYSVIREQAGDPVKALAELVMNSMDAGATEIHLVIDSEKFKIIDNGVGFRDTETIEKFFGTFGSPHKEGDATYGKFRIGRGQVFSIAKTNWRSGLHGMHVDLGSHSKTDEHGYELYDYNIEQPGCVIEGEFYTSLNKHEKVATPELFNEIFKNSLSDYCSKIKEGKFDFNLLRGYSFFSRLVRAIALVKVDIFINGILITPKNKMKCLLETDEAIFYEVISREREILLFNKGIYIDTLHRSFSMIVDFKKSPNLNMARNQINENCKVLKKVNLDMSKLVLEHFLKNEKWASYAYDDMSHLFTEFFKLKNGGVNNYSAEKYFDLLDKKTAEDLLRVIKISYYNCEKEKILRISVWEVLQDILKNPDFYECCNDKQCWRFNINSNERVNNYLNTILYSKNLIFSSWFFGEKKENLIAFIKNFIGEDMGFDIQINQVIESDVDFDQYSNKSLNTQFNLDNEKLEGRELVVQSFLSAGIITPFTVSKIKDRIGEAEQFIFNLINSLKKYFIEIFEKNDFPVNERWRLFSDRKVVPVITKMARVRLIQIDFDIDFEYLLLDESDLFPLDLGFIFEFLFSEMGEHHTEISVGDLCGDSISIKKYYSSNMYANSDSNQAFHDILNYHLKDTQLSDLLFKAKCEFNQIWVRGRAKPKNAIYLRKFLSMMENMDQDFQGSVKHYAEIKNVSI